MSKRYCLDLEKEKIIKLYLEDKMSCSQIATKLGYSISGIYDALKRWNIKTRDLASSHKIYSFNNKFFEVIDTEEKAYWLGFIYADGYITGNCIGISLANRDRNHLEKLSSSIKSNYPINTYKSKSVYGIVEYCRLVLKDKIAVEHIKNKGVLEKKSLILKFPESKILNENLYSHFIRGYFDGDGSLILSKNSINFKICGTKEMLISFIDIFNKISKYEFKYKLFKRYEDNKNNFYISYGGRRKTLSIMNYLYENSSIYLDRKYKKYIDLKYNN